MALSARAPVRLGIKAAQGHSLPSIDVPSSVGTTTPKFADFDLCRAWIAPSGSSTPNAESTAPTAPVTSIQQQALDFLQNKVKQCASCGKPNGFTLHNCNSCGSSLAHVALSFTPNVFAGFMFSIGKSSFPLKISIRHECPDFIVLDDLLSLAPCHINCIPTKHAIPDWRYLLRKPHAGLALIRQMKAHCVRVARTQFFSNEQWAKTFVADAPRALQLARGSSSSPADPSQQTANLETETPALPTADDEAFYAEYIGAGFNYPPSQYQLHLQFMYAGVLPYQYWMFQCGHHFTEGRFFPFEFVEAALEAVRAVGVPSELLAPDAPMEALTAHLQGAHQLDAEAYRRDYCARFDRLYLKHQAWDKMIASASTASAPAVVSGDAEAEEARLTYTYLASTSMDNGKERLLAVPTGENASENEAAAVLDQVELTKIVNADRVALQGYGRPYDAATGAPGGKFYAHPVQNITEVAFW
jgi:hypothetical protein